VLDGFFDFTPVQGEMLRQLIRQVPDVVVNLNSDERNPSIFEPFSSTIEQLKGIADFKLKFGQDYATTSGALFGLREKLFNRAKHRAMSAGRRQPATGEYSLITCADRETEIRKIAKEIKRLVVKENYRVGEIALVVRERASYADTIARLCAMKRFPAIWSAHQCQRIPAVRAARSCLICLRP